MDIKFQPQAVELLIFLTPNEAKEIFIDLPPEVLQLKTRPIAKLARCLQIISMMNADEVLREIKDYSDPGWRVAPDERPGQEAVSRA